MTFVLVHGGGFDHRCWDPLVPRLDGEANALDMPGRGDIRVKDRDDDAEPEWTIADFAGSVVDLLEDKDLTDVVLVGHSLAGITLPVVAGLVPDRIRRLVFVSASVPSQGSSVADELESLSPAAAEVALRIGEEAVTEDGVLHRDLALAMFCNDMTDEQVAFTLERMVPETYDVVMEPVDLSGLEQPVPRTYIRLLRDHSLDLAAQDRMIEHLGGPSAVDVIDVDASHMAMIAAPDTLATVLNRLA